jgi:DNA-binding transcriptional ArsR family regulator
MLKALADDTRWALVTELVRRPSTVTELTERLTATQYNVSKHLKILREAGIIESEREGKNIRYAVLPSFKPKLANGRKHSLDLGCCTFDL